MCFQSLPFRPDARRMVSAAMGRVSTQPPLQQVHRRAQAVAPAPRRYGPQGPADCEVVMITVPVSAVREACLEAGMTVAEACGEGRTARMSAKRFHVMTILRDRHGWSTTRIGRALGGRDHTTVIHGLRRHAEIIARAPSDPDSYGGA
jgi:hypothetical protein